MIILLFLLVVAVSLIFFGYSFVKAIAPFVFFIAGVALAYYVARQQFDSVIINIAITVFAGTVVGFILATFSSIILSLAIVAAYTLAVYNGLIFVLHQQLNAPIIISQILAIIIITVTVLATIDTYIMRYIITASASIAGAYLLFRVILASTGIEKSQYLHFGSSAQNLAILCAMLAVAGYALQVYYLKRSLRPHSDPGLLSLNDYHLADK